HLTSLYAEVRCRCCFSGAAHLLMGRAGKSRRRCEASEVCGVRMPRTRTNVVIHSRASPTTILSKAVTLMTDNINASTVEPPTKITSIVVTALSNSVGFGSTYSVYLADA